MSFTLTFCSTLFHFFILLSDIIYSLKNRFQYILDRLSTTLHLHWLSISFSFISTTPCVFENCPDIKWFGVNTIKSSASSLIDVKGWVLIVPLIWTRVVIHWSFYIGQLFVTDFGAFLATLTNDSAQLIHWLLGGMKCHWIFELITF